MKNRQEFYNEFINVLNGELKEIRKLEDVLENRKKKVSSGMFDSKYVEDVLKPEIKRMETGIAAYKKDADIKLKALCEDYKIQIHNKEILNPSDLNDDILLLQTGITLDSEDIKALLKRNAKNATMTRMLFKYAQQHDIDVSDLQYIGNQPLIDAIDALAGTTETVIKRHDNPIVYERLLGESSELAQMFRGDE